MYVKEGSRMLDGGFCILHLVHVRPKHMDLHTTEIIRFA